MLPIEVLYLLKARLGGNFFGQQKLGFCQALALGEQLDGTSKESRGGRSTSESNLEEISCN